MGPDLAAENLLGLVKRVETVSHYEYTSNDDGSYTPRDEGYGESVAFDENGFYADNHDAEVTRGDDEYITSQGDGAMIMMYQWADGRLVRLYSEEAEFDWNFQLRYEYDDEGRVVAEHNTGSEAGDFVVSYTYLGFDATGNWTSRLAIVSYDDGEDEEYDEEGPSNMLQFRKIEYY